MGDSFSGTCYGINACTDACQRGCSGPTKGTCEIVAENYSAELGIFYCGGSSCTNHCQGWTANSCSGSYCSYMCVNYCDWGGTGNGCTGGCGFILSQFHYHIIR